MNTLETVVLSSLKCVQRIEQLNGRINAITTPVPSAVVLKQLQAIDTKIVDPRKPLAGRLVAFKDNMCTTSLTTSCASNMLKDFMSPYNATVVEKLLDAGAISVGKTNMDEFAMGTDNINTIYGPPLNPLYEVETSTGGSSGGSAAAVASGMCFAALGTDTGGSVRLPAAYCGIVGFKPSYGLISRWGVIAYAQSLDTVGILAQEVEDVKTVFDILTEYDSKDPTSWKPTFREQVAQQIKTVRTSRTRPKFGVPHEFNLENLSPVVRKGWSLFLKKILGLEYEIYKVSIPTMKHALPTYYIIAPAEAASNLARYDGVRYGFRAETDRDESDQVPYGMTRAIGFGKEVRRRILLGNYNLTSDSLNNHYLQAQRVRALLRRDFDAVFSLPNPLSEGAASSPRSPTAVDFLITPCSTDLPPTLQAVQSRASPLDAYVNDVLTVPASLVGIPAITIPFSFNYVDPETKLSEKKTIGIQLLAQMGDDYSLLASAQELS
ncbi:amidase signature domain-containing protein [Lipomyces oligophaga]|uniref:amidase signature domain-containing protein n=1 Tax=Lipomyces oligophaga TaxID=45792 RepID=UPI0034CDC30A